MAVIYRVNMTDLSVRVEESADIHRGLGGRGLTSALVAREVPPHCHPLSAENRLVIAPGTLTGTGAPCLFVAFAVLDNAAALEGICKMLGGLYGRPFSSDEFLALGKKTLAIERAFNAAAGFTAADDRLPDFFRTEKLAPHNTTFRVPDEELDKVFAGIA